MRIGVVAQNHPRMRRLAKPRGVLHDRVKDRLIVVTALADDTNDFTAGLLALQPDLQFAELAHILNGDNGRPGEGLNELDLPIVKRPDLAAEERDDADRLTACG